MKTHRPRSKRGVTLIEMSLVIFLLVALMSTGLYFSTAIKDWKLGRNASEDLRLVYTAQRSYLADHPTTRVSDITEAMIRQYMPNNSTTIPMIEGLDGVKRSIRVNVSPPVIVGSGGGVYDPSGNSSDSLWDVGE